MSQSSKILVNTIILYVKAIISLFIGFLTTRYVLDALGVENFGIYSLIGGTIAFLSFLQICLSSSTQRFLSFHSEEQNNKKLCKVFNVGFFLHVLIGIFLVLLLIAGSLFLFNGVLNIDTSHLVAAKFVFYCMVGGTFFTIISSPYDAYLISQENIKIYALIQLCESISKFVIAIFLYHTCFNVLKTYGLSMGLLSIFSFISKKIYCNKRYSDTKIKFSEIYDKKLFINMLSFSGYMLVELIAKIFKLQGMTVLFNLHYGIIANAAYGISNQVGGNISGYAGSIFKSSSPQILVHVNRNEIEIAIKKTLSASKLACIIMTIFAIPLIIEMPYVLQIWLKNVPEYTISFCRVTLLTPIIMSMVNGLNALLEGMENIKTYRLCTSICHLCAIIIAIVFMNNNYNPVIGIISILISDIMTLAVAVYFSYKYTKMSIRHFIYEIPLRVFFIAGMVFFLVSNMSFSKQSYPFVELVCVSLLSTILMTVSSWFFILNHGEKMLVKKIVGKVKNKFF